MRARFVGYTEDRPPVPATSIVPPIDPPDEPEEPEGGWPAPLILEFDNGDVFNKADYQALGYNRFDVMCIGASGGRGGGYLTGQYARYYFASMYAVYARVWAGMGGAPGGGGVHRVKGRLALLPSSCAVVVGAPGADGTSELSFLPGEYAGADHAAMPAGGDGGASTFGGTVCRASGGKGGQGAASQTALGIFLPAKGGQGGMGGVAGSGGGGAAVQSIVEYDPDDPMAPFDYSTTNGDGSWNGSKGGGGGGGSQVLVYSSSPDSFYTEGQNPQYSIAPAAGGHGAKSVVDTLTGSPGEARQDLYIAWQKVIPDPMGWAAYTIENHNLPYPIFPGAGGGAKTFLIDGNNEEWGTKKGGRPGNGRVVMRLSYQVV